VLAGTPQTSSRVYVATAATAERRTVCAPPCPSTLNSTCWASREGDAQETSIWCGSAVRARCTPRGSALSAMGTMAVASTPKLLMHHSVRWPQSKSTIMASVPMFVMWKR
jgi:hypothetical protein